jgi:allophanate hydrolase
VSAMLEVATMLYEAPFLAERLAAFGHLLEPDGPHLDPTVRRIVLGARGLQAEHLFAAQHRLALHARRAATATASVDAVLLPTTPFHPTLADVAADPVGVNSRLGTYTNMANLLDLCAVAIPAGRRPDGLPFGIQLLAPAFADTQLLDLASMVNGERAPNASPPIPADRRLLAVCGAHLSGQPLNPVLTDAGARLYQRGHTAAGYRMVRLEGPMPRPGLLDDGTGPSDGIEVELWEAPVELVRRLSDDVEPPLEIGQVRLWDGSTVAGFTANAGVPRADDISAAGGWRAHLARRRTSDPTT